MTWEYLKAELPGELRGRLVRRARIGDGLFMVMVLRQTSERAHEWQPVSVLDHPELAELMREPDAWSAPMGSAR